MWKYETHAFEGGCMQEHPCPAGQRGSHPAPWVTRPWKLRHGLKSKKAYPKEVGACKLAPCPAHAYFNLSTSLCTCGGDYHGALEWNLTAEAYDGRCIPNWRCPRKAVHRLLPKWRVPASKGGSTMNYQLGCACKDGYRGGHTTWGSNGRRWHGSCHRVQCPHGTSLLQGGLCSCPYGQAGVRWSRKYSTYIGHCYLSGHTTTSTSTTHTTTTLNFTTSSDFGTTNAPEEAQAGGKPLGSGRSSTTAETRTNAQHLISTTAKSLAAPNKIIRSKTGQSKKHEVTQTELIIGEGMYVAAAIALVIGISISCREAWAYEKAQSKLEEQRRLLQDSSSDDDSLASAREASGSTLEFPPATSSSSPPDTVAEGSRISDPAGSGQKASGGSGQAISGSPVISQSGTVGDAEPKKQKISQSVSFDEAISSSGSGSLKSDTAGAKGG